METFTVVRHGDWRLAWCDGWPGLLAGGASEVDVADALPLALAEYRGWLNGNGEEGPSPEFEIGAQVDFTEWDASGRDPCLPADRLPLSREKLARFIRHAELSQRDLRAAAEVPKELLDWVPKGLVAERPDSWAPDVRTIRGILAHALQLEVFYRDGLKDGAACGIFERVGDAEIEQAATVTRIRDVWEAHGDRAFCPERYNPARTATEPDEWTVRKVLRRVISHNRAHAAEIVQRRTRVLLGPG